jgi:hypothetical protein
MHLSAEGCDPARPVNAALMLIAQRIVAANNGRALAK